MKNQVEMKTAEKTGLVLIEKEEYKKREAEHFTRNGDNIDELMKMIRENKESLGSFFGKKAEMYSNNVFIKFEGTELSYKEFNELVNQYSNYFISLGLKKGEVVEIMLENRPELLIIFMACAKIGAISSMINPNLRKRTLAYCINLTPGKLIAIGEECYEAFKEIISDISLGTESKLCFIPEQGNIPVPEDFEDLPELVKDYPINNPITTDSLKIFDPVAYFFTSGTTGLPKAAFSNHYSFIALGYVFGIWTARLTPKDTLYNCLPLFHATALKVCFPSVLTCGASYAIGRKFSVSNFWKDIRNYNATAFSYVGELCRYLINHPRSPDESNNSVKAVIGNGLRPEIWMDFKTRFDIPRIGEFYGASEGNSIFANYYNFDYTVGVNTAPYAIVEYDIENETPIYTERGRMKRVRKGGTGLLLLQSIKPYIFLGYTSKKATDAKLFRNVFQEGDEWFNTGDLMRDLGFKHAQFVDRLGDTFRWKAHNVSTTEVEEVLNVNEQVLMSTVYGVKIPDTDGRAGMATIVPNIDLEDFNFKALSDLFGENLASYAVPIFLRFKSELVITPTFKFKKVALKEEGFDIKKVEDPIYIMLPGASDYTVLTEEIYDDILSLKYKF